jgi:hypothetical protein
LCDVHFSHKWQMFTAFFQFFLFIIQQEMACFGWFTITWRTVQAWHPCIALTSWRKNKMVRREILVGLLHSDPTLFSGLLQKKVELA